MFKTKFSSGTSRLLIAQMVTLSTLFTGLPAHAEGEPNVLPILVGGGNQTPNIPYVSVTICVPGTQTCQTIDRVQVDTGSSGLRVFASVVKISLASVRASAPGVNAVAANASAAAANAATLAECVHWGDGKSYFGSLKTADVLLGGETARAITVQTVESAPFGIACPGSATSPEASDMNGVLGVGFGPRDFIAGGEGNPEYYACVGGNSCQAFAPSPAQTVHNPVIHLDVDNNGVVVRLPAIPAGGAARAAGQLILGLGTRTNNQIEDGAARIQTASTGRFVIQLNGKPYLGAIDTGTGFVTLPAALRVPGCDPLPAYACPVHPTVIGGAILNRDGSVAQNLSLPIVNARSLDDSGNLAFSNLAVILGGTLGEQMILGLSFFFGKSVYIAIDGQTHAPGPAAFAAIAPN